MCMSHYLDYARLPLISFEQNNLVRCLLGAGLVALIDIILNALGTGWTYVLLGGICALLAPVIPLMLWLGPRSRAKRRERRAANPGSQL